MLSKIIQAEHVLNSLLPRQRVDKSPAPELRASAIAWSQAVWDEALASGPIALSGEQVEKGVKLAQSPVFVCGVHRSGTTLVRDLLDGHPNLVVLPSEGTYYTNLELKLKTLTEEEQCAFMGKEWLRRLANPINQPPFWLLGRSSDTGSPYLDFARYILAWWKVIFHKEFTQWPHTVIILAYASVTGKLDATCWVDKTPTNERFIERIWKEMPAAKIIHVIRDPVATLSSRKKLEPSFDIRVALHDLKTSFKTAVEYSALHDPRFLLLRYEALCAEPVTITETLARFLNIMNSEVLATPSVAGMPSQANSSFNKDATSGKIIRPDQLQRREVLNKDERQILSAHVGQLAATLNFPLVKISSVRSFYLKLKYRLL